MASEKQKSNYWEFTVDIEAFFKLEIIVFAAATERLGRTTSFRVRGLMAGFGGHAVKETCRLRYVVQASRLVPMFHLVVDFVLTANHSYIRLIRHLSCNIDAWSVLCFV